MALKPISLDLEAIAQEHSSLISGLIFKFRQQILLNATL